MSKVDWSKAPEGAEFYANGSFWKVNELGNEVFYHTIYRWCVANRAFSATRLPDYESRPKEWPSEQRIEQIGQNGAAGEHYEAIESSGAKGFSKDPDEFFGKELKVYADSAAESTHSHDNQKELTKYQRNIKGAVIDVYDLLVAYNVTCPAIAHAIKKCLMPGERHAKTWEQDINEAIASLERAKGLRG